MKKQFRRKYRKIRAEFKHELKELCKKDINLKWLIWEAYRADRNKDNIYDIYYWLDRKYPDVWREFIKTPLWGGVITGEYGIWYILRGTYPDIAKKYADKIPDRSAMGDAIAVIYGKRYKNDNND